MRKIEQVRATAGAAIRAKAAALRVWAGTVNWTVTLWRWAWHVAGKVFIFAAIGFFLMDAVVFGAALHYGWNFVFDAGTVTATGPEVVKLAKDVLHLKVMSSIAVGVFGCMIGWRGPETAYKRGVFRPVTN